MKKLSSILSCGMLVAAGMTSFTVSAVNIDQITLEKDGIQVEYWNDFKNDVTATNFNNIFPQWRVRITDAQKEAFPVGTKGTMNYVVKNATDGTVYKDGSVNGTIGNDFTYHNYIEIQAANLPDNAEMQSLLTLTLIAPESTDPTIIVFDPVNFTYTKVKADPTAPEATLTWTMVPGVNEAYLDYAVELKNLDDKNPVVRVWLDRPGNITADESNDNPGRLTVVPANGAETLWVKATVTYMDGDKEVVLNAKGNDTGVAFTCTNAVEPITLTCSNLQPTSNSSATLEYTIAGDMTDVTKINIYAVTNAFGSDVEVGRIENLTADQYSGVLTLTNLKESAVNEIWCKLEVYKNDVKENDEFTYPGAAQGWTGFSVDTSNVSVSEIIAAEDGEVVYYNLQGVRVANPSNGLYIRVQGKKATKVLVNE